VVDPYSEFPAPGCTVSRLIRKHPENGSLSAKCCYYLAQETWCRYLMYIFQFPLRNKRREASQ